MDDEKSLLLNQYMPYRLVNLARRVSDDCNATFGAANGISVAEWRILAKLGQHNELSSRGLPESTFMDKSRVSRALRQLEDKGYAQLRADDNDNRARMITITAAGKALYQTIVPQALDWEAEFLSALSTTEFRDLLLIMQKLETQLDVKARQSTEERNDGTS